MIICCFSVSATKDFVCVVKLKHCFMFSIISRCSFGVEVLFCYTDLKAGDNNVLVNRVVKLTF